LLAVLLVATALRTWKLDSLPHGLCGDEAIEALQGVALWNGEKLPELAVPRIPYPRWPVWCAVSGLSTAIGGTNMAAVRAPSVFAGLAAVVLAFLTGRMLLGRTAGTGAAAFLAFSFWHVHFSRIGVPFHLSVAESLLIALLLLRPSALGWRSGAAAAAVAVVACLGYAGSLVVPAIAVMFMAIRLAFRPAGVREYGLAAGFAGVAVPGAVLLLAMRPESAGRILDVGLASPGLWPAQAAECLRNYCVPVRAKGGFWQNYPAGSARFAPIEFAFILAGLAAAGLRGSLARWQSCALGSWWAVSLLPEVLPGGGTHLIRALSQLAPVALVAGAGAAGIAGLGRAGAAATLVLFALAGAHTWTRFFDRFANDTQAMGWHNALEARIAGRVNELARKSPILLTPPVAYPSALRFHLLKGVKSGSIEYSTRELAQSSLLEVFREPASQQPVFFVFEAGKPSGGRRHIGLVNIFGLLREGDNAYWMRRYRQAEDQFRGVLAMVPDSAAARGHLGLALASQGKCREAEPHLRYALNFSPQDGKLRRALDACAGNALKGKGSAGRVGRTVPKGASKPE